MSGCMSEKFLITGGSGFIGSNLANSLLSDGFSVTVLDSLARSGAQNNLAWLRTKHGNGRLEFVHGDIRDFATVQSAVKEVDVIYHFAGQVAVTSSVDDPRLDFEVNSLGTLNVLEAARLSERKPIVIEASTNKVYGRMESVETVELESRYMYRDLPHGISESQPLDFHSPYGCSKGSADQYVRDYSRIYGLRTVVFRMSCIYGPRQFGNEDQGWLVHLILAAENGTPITIYGDGKQVRDVLFIDDLIKAYRLAVEKIDATAGQVYNIGGGPSNTISIWKEFGPLLSQISGREIPVVFENWRPGDQLCYISDIRKAKLHMGWQPQVTSEAGLRQLREWVCSNKQLLAPPKPKSGVGEVGV
jgi:CDP-paratose 2-epimerase